MIAKVIKNPDIPVLLKMIFFCNLCILFLMVKKITRSKDEESLYVLYRVFAFVIQNY